MSEEDSLRRRLRDVEATLDAIRSGSVDALVIDGSDGQRVYTVESADVPYRQFLEQMAEGAVSLDASSTILFCNSFFSELLGLPHEGVLGSSFEEFVAPEKLVAYRAALRAEHPQRFGSALQLQNGESVPIQLAVTPVGAGASRRYTVVVTDLSERERLSAAREAVEAESLAKDRFLAGLGHELRGPLNIIMGWAAMLAEQVDSFDSQARKAVEAIDRNSKLQHRLIEDMLDVARISSGKLRVERHRLDLADLVEATGVGLTPAAHDKGVSLTVEASPGTVVSGDAQRLEQMLQNLVGNAIKFTPRGGHVGIALEQSEDTARLEVRDDGRGIDPGLLAVIFQPFRQAASSGGAQRHSGLGLGLAITKQIVELHGGHVRVESAGLGLGATFIVELPLQPAHAPSGPDDLDVDLVGRRVLVVDDDEESCEQLARALTYEGAEVVCVSGAESALARLENQPFDAVVSDLLMPGTDGWEFARALRKRYGSELPLLAVSGARQAGLADRTAQSGYQQLLHKPFSPVELRTALRQLFAPRAS